MKFIAKCVAVVCASIIDHGRGNLFDVAENIYRWIMYTNVEDQPGASLK